MEHKSLDDYSKFKANPFAKDTMKYLVMRKTKHSGSSKEVAIYDKKTGEQLDVEAVESKAIYIRRYVDTQEFKKTFNNSIKELMGLNKTAQKIFTYIDTIIEINKDTIVFSMEECKKYCNYNSNQIVYTGLAMLIEADIIARTKEHFRYWINPTMIFNGNRLLLINEYINQDENNILEESNISYRIKE